MGKKSDESGRERGKVSILRVVALWGDCRNIVKALCSIPVFEDCLMKS
jgi:hypothetical protein